MASDPCLVICRLKAGYNVLTDKRWIRTTRSQEIMERIADFLPSPCGRQAYFEVHAKARNQPIVPYKPVVMHVNQDIVEFKKLILRKDKAVEIDWVSLDRQVVDGFMNAC